MRTSALQDLYLQRPTTTIILICIISILPWIGLGDFSTKGEPREAAVAVSMIETGDWILPEAYADEFAYKPPMAHWMMALFSLPQGEVTEFSSRLPSALAFIFLIGIVVVFFGKRLVKFQEVLLTALLLITCVEIHRAAMTTRVDMLLTVFMIAGLFQLYRWEEKLELKGLPILIPIFLGCAVLTKGWVGVVLPLFVFGVYLLMLRKYRLKRVVKALCYIGVSSLFIPTLWYLAAWQQGGNDFLRVVFAENFGRFFHIDVPEITYDLGHENGIWYNFMTVFLGFIPWSILFLFSLFGLKFTIPGQSLLSIMKQGWQKVLQMDKVRLFSLVAICCIFFFYCIPSSKRSVYLMPAYPFIALFLAQYLLYLTEYRTKVTRVFAAFICSLVSLVFIALLLVTTGVIDPVAIVQSYTDSESALQTTQQAVMLFQSRDVLAVALLCVLGLFMVTLYYQLFRKINIKILYATIALTFAVNMIVDGAIMRGIRLGSSSRPFAERLLAEYPLDNTNTYVMNTPKLYKNLYGLNFYMDNSFSNFEKSQPDNGYFLGGEKDLEKVKDKYKGKYTFDILTSTDQRIAEIRQRIVLCRFVRNR